MIEKPRSPTVDAEGIFRYDDGSIREPYVWRKGDPASDGKTYDTDAPDEERMVAELLMNEVLFLNSREYLGLSWSGTEQKAYPETLVLFVNCNDIFDWACADAASVTMAELPALYEAWKADNKANSSWGVAKWCALKRKRRPQPPVEARMKAANVWNEAMEALTR